MAGRRPRILRPLRAVTATARTITDTDLSGRIPVPADARDELADLARSVNAMLDRVERGVAPGQSAVLYEPDAQRGDRVLGQAAVQRCA